jgi:hypothetical protein
VAGGREERQRRREARLEAERREAAAERRRQLVGYVVAGLLGVAVLAGLVVVIASGGSGGTDPAIEAAPNAHINTDFGVAEGIEPDNRDGTSPPALAQGDLEIAAEAAGCELRLELPDEGSDHSTGEEGGDYETRPPTSGDHFGSGETASGAAADGAYRETPPIGRAVHSLEHSRVEIQYQPDLDEEAQLALKGVFDESPGGVLLFPNPDMPYAVAATSWTRLIGCERYRGSATLDAIRDFRDLYRGQGPEAVPLA